MGKLLKKGIKGAASVYTNRNRALKKLQLTLADFRRLCILKGIYPRQPKNKKKANKGSTAPRTYYYTKDIQYLLHEPLVQKLREKKIHLRKLAKAKAKKQNSILESLKKRAPDFSLDHIVKERYPTFIDALRDIDDALCMLFLFANLPADERLIKTTTIQKCQQLSMEFQHYVMHTSSLNKVFLSIKGIYYRATIRGQDITWVVPYMFKQEVPKEVDLRVMLTFLDFYMTLVGFVNFKLFSDCNLKYPPKIDIKAEENGGGLVACVIEPSNADCLQKIMNVDASSIQEVITVNESQMKKLETEMTSIQEQDKVHAEEEEEPVGIIMDEEEEEEEVSAQSSTHQTSDNSKLFSSCYFFLSREVPRYSLEFVIKSFGGTVGWEESCGSGSPYQVNDPVITHHICDRPIQSHRFLNRIYVQPQWLYDSINASALLKPIKYLPGVALPPHLSPFAKYADGSYNPEEEEEEEPTIRYPDIDEEEGSIDEEESHSESELDSEDEIALHQEELEAEAKGLDQDESVLPNKKNHIKKAVAKKKELLQAENVEQKKLSMIMMSKKDKALYSKIEKGKKRKQEEVENLKRKRHQIRKQKKKSVKA